MASRRDLSEEEHSCISDSSPPVSLYRLKIKTIIYFSVCTFRKVTVNTQGMVETL